MRHLPDTSQNQRAVRLHPSASSPPPPTAGFTFPAGSPRILGPAGVGSDPRRTRTPAEVPQNAALGSAKSRADWGVKHPNQKQNYTSRHRVQNLNERRMRQGLAGPPQAQRNRALYRRSAVTLRSRPLGLVQTRESKSPSPGRPMRNAISLPCCFPTERFFSFTGTDWCESGTATHEIRLPPSGTRGRASQDREGGGNLSARRVRELACWE